MHQYVTYARIGVQDSVRGAFTCCSQRRIVHIRERSLAFLQVEAKKAVPKEDNAGIRPQNGVSQAPQRTKKVLRHCAPTLCKLLL